MNDASFPVLFVTCLAAAGCSHGTSLEPTQGASGTAGASGNAGAAGDAGGSSGAGGNAGAAGSSGTAGAGGVVVPGAIGIVVIDVQETFVDGAANSDIAAILDRTKSDFQLADDKAVPFFVTFEDSKSGDHALYAPLQAVLPGQAKDFIKTTYAATGQTAFAGAVKQAGLSHLVVLGAETDVCVMQTVLGLRKMGFTVLLQKDAVFTEETNTSPALRRMQQAGVLLISQADVPGYVADQGALPKGNDSEVRIVDPMHMGVVLNDFTDSAVKGSGDPMMTQKSARLRELLLVSEWFELPVYVNDVGAGLPADFASYFQGQLRPMSQIGQDGSVTQLVFAGTDGGLAGSMSAWIGSRDLFVMEDALLALGTPAAQKDILKPFFDKGLVPTTYKSFYYEMTQSTDVAEWPSSIWVQKYDEYYWITQAPEDLPPIPPN